MNCFGQANGRDESWGVLEHGGNSGSDETWWLYRYILKLELSEDIFKGMM